MTLAQKDANKKKPAQPMKARGQVLSLRTG